MSMNKKIMIPALLTALSFFGMIGMGKVNASQTPSYPPIIQKLAERFNLSVDDIQTVFDEERNERQQKMQDAYEEKLNQAITNGKITEAQKQRILEKRKEMEANRPKQERNMEGKTEEERQKEMKERKTEMEQERKNLEAWAKENGIDVSFLFGFGMREGRPDVK